MKKFFHKIGEYIDAMFYSSLQAKLAVASFLVGATMCLLCVFWVPPPGEISTSAIQATGMFLVLAGAAAGIKVAFDLQSQKFNAMLDDTVRKFNRMEEGDNGRRRKEESDGSAELF